MSIEITIVPKDKCPLEVLAELGEKTAGAWIFLHTNVVQKLRSTAEGLELFYNSFNLKWNNCPKQCSTLMKISETPNHLLWHEVLEMNSKNIAFKHPSINPNEIFFLQMEVGA